MSEAAETEPKARLFVALDLPEEIRAGIAGWQAEELGDEALRPVRPEALHVTLCFLGWRLESEIPAIAEIVIGDEPAAKPIPLTLDPKATPIPPRRPRLLALGAPSEPATRLQAQLSERLSAAGLYEPEGRPFWPHVTVARVRSGRGGRKPRKIERRPGELPQELVHTFDSIRLALYRSNLRPEGAQYVSLASQDLPPPARPVAGKR